MTTSPRDFKNIIYEQLARVGKALASGPRLEILAVLCQGPRTVEALAKHVGQPAANTSHHLQVLKRARLVDTEKTGVRVTYRLAGPEVCAFYLALRRLAESRLLEIEQVTRQFLEERGAMEAVDRQALIERVERGEVTVLDVHPEEEYAAGHIPGALSIPLSQLKERLDILPPEREVVAYCRGPYCVLAVEAVPILNRSDRRAVRLRDGFPEWKEAGLPVDTA